MQSRCKTASWSQISQCCSYCAASTQLLHAAAQSHWCCPDCISPHLMAVAQSLRLSERAMMHNKRATKGQPFRLFSAHHACISSLSFPPPKAPPVEVSTGIVQRTRTWQMPGGYGGLDCVGGLVQDESQCWLVNAQLTYRISSPSPTHTPCLHCHTLRLHSSHSHSLPDACTSAPTLLHVRTRYYAH